MNKDFNNQSDKGLKFMTMKQVGDEINLRGPKSIRKWLVERCITIHKLSSKSYVYKIDFDLQSDKPLVMNLRRTNPQNWKEMYRAITPNDALFNLMMLEMEQEVFHLPTTKVSVRSKNDEKLLRALVA
jgi:hypothetical protein